MRPKDDIIKELTERYKDHLGGHPICVKAGAVDKWHIDRSQRLVTGVITVASPDSEGEVVLPSGLDTSYFPGKIKTVYLGHDYEKPIGRCRNIDIKKKSVVATTFITSTALGEDALTMMEEGVIEGWSIGFAKGDFGIPTQKEIDDFGDHDTIHRTAKLFEYSATPMPCHGDARTMMITKDKVMKIEAALSSGKIHRSSAVAFGLPDTPERKFHSAYPIVCEDGTVILPPTRTK